MVYKVELAAAFGLNYGAGCGPFANCACILATEVPGVRAGLSILHDDPEITNGF
jgi:hypothetical protein